MYKNGSNVKKKKVRLQNLLEGISAKSNLATSICTHNVEIRRETLKKLLENLKEFLSK